MKLADTGIDTRIVKVLSEDGIETLYPPQCDAIPHLLAAKNVVCAAPTASGKSIIAYVALLNSVLKGGKALYVVPLRAIAVEKYTDLCRFEKIGVKVGLSIGDYDKSADSLEKYDIIVTTAEKADSILRHKTHWLKKITVFIADEVHLLGDRDRGAVLETTLTKFKQFNPAAQLVALSATIGNSNELAEWLRAEHIKSDWRPVKLKEGIYCNGAIRFSDGSKRTVDSVGDEVTSIVADTIKTGGQALVFTATRKSAEQFAEQCAPYVAKFLSRGESAQLKCVADEITSASEEITITCMQLANCIKKGIAFHHAGLANNQRLIVENYFKSGTIKCIVATPTLAAGINLPARVVIIRDLKKFDSKDGFGPLPVLDAKQMAGRAGRPKYDKVGEAVYIARDISTYKQIRERYLNGEPEPIYSKFGVQDTLRTHILALIASSTVVKRNAIDEFISNTFYAKQAGTELLKKDVEEVLSFLQTNKLIIQENEAYKPTALGMRASRLYIDPLSAVRFQNALENASAKTVTQFSYLHTICTATEMPKLYITSSDYKNWVNCLGEVADSLLVKVPAENQVSDFLLAEIKTAKLIESWIEELPEKYIVSVFGIWPGDLHNRVEHAEWLMYSLCELARSSNFKDYETLVRLLTRIKYGVKTDLLELVQIEGIGRQRARALWKNGYKKLSDLKTATPEELTQIEGISKNLAENIKKQVSGVEPQIDYKNSKKLSGQTKLFDF